MIEKKALYLQEMGIARWQVRKPELFSHLQKKQETDLSTYSLLVLGAELELSNPLMINILKAFKFSVEDVYYCSTREFENYQGTLPEYIWSMAGKFELSGHKLLTSPPLSMLANNPKEKKALWEQFCAFN